MPRPTTDIVEAASRCFHFNMSMLVPDYIVIYSPRRATYAVTTVGIFALYRANKYADDWHIAIQLDSAALMSLMGLVPPKPLARDHTQIWKPDHTQPNPTPEIREVANHASGPENL
jgi:hypothetical protein